MARPRKYATEEEATEARRARQRAYDKEKRPEHGGKKKKGKEPWEPAFVGVDGESFETGELLPDGTPKQAYCLLLRNDQGPIFNPKGISTFEALAYLTYNPPRKTALVGYFLNFDFEWILKDLTQDEYKALQHGETVPVYDGEFVLQWFVGKKMIIYRFKNKYRHLDESEWKLSKHYSMTTIQDVSGFFQQSFMAALEKWGFYKKNKDGTFPDDIDPRIITIANGKAARGAFTLDKADDVEYYNKCEMDLLEELMMKVYHSFKGAYEEVDLEFNVNSGTWSGPGVFANDFLKQTRWVEEHVSPAEEFREFFGKHKNEFFGNEVSKSYPFSLAYYGGRIEVSGVGRFGAGFNYDINSAYPYALSLLPKWGPEDFAYLDYVGRVIDPQAIDFLSRRLMGMYTVRFSFPDGWTWYPFPVRNISYGAPNVYYPREGLTHIMSAELFAVLDTLPLEALQYVEVLDAVVLEGSDGYGDALSRMPADRLCTTAKETLRLADVRLDMKKRKLDAEKALKLILNSLYGKTVQQIGSHKYYSDFASAWITSVCRALLWRAIAPERATQNVLMTMTDGVYSRVALPFAAERLTSILGEWEETRFDTFETFKPGIYRYSDGDGMHYKVRGFLTPTDDDRERLFKMTWDAMTTGAAGLFPARQFLTRNLCLEGWKREPYLRQFYTDRKEIKSELKAKREPNTATEWLIPDGQAHVFFRPKGEHLLNNSKGYALQFEVLELDADDDELIEQYVQRYDANIGLEEFYNVE